MLEQHRIGDCTAVISEHPEDGPFGEPAALYVVEIFMPGDDPASDRPVHIGYAADLQEAHSEAFALGQLAQLTHEEIVGADWDAWERQFNNAEELPRP